MLALDDGGLITFDDEKLITCPRRIASSQMELVVPWVVFA